MVTRSGGKKEAFETQSATPEKRRISLLGQSRDGISSKDELAWSKSLPNGHAKRKRVVEHTITDDEEEEEGAITPVRKVMSVCRSTDWFSIYSY